MAKKHDEGRDLSLFSKVGRIDYSTKTLQAAKAATIGIHMWGRIDFLTHYCGWTFVWNNEATASRTVPNDNDEAKKPKKEKEHKLTDKRKKK